MALIDDLDRQIIDALQENGRAPNGVVGRAVGVTEPTVRRRLKRLISEGIIRVAALPSLEALGLRTEALVGIQADPGKIDSVATDLIALKEVSLVVQATGSFDFFVWVAFPSTAELDAFLTTKLRAIAGIRRTETFVSLSVWKRTYAIRLG